MSFSWIMSWASSISLTDALAVIGAVTSVIAISISIYCLVRDKCPLTVIPPTELRFVKDAKLVISLSSDKIGTVNAFGNDNISDMYIASFRIINSKPHPVTIFNINVLNDDKSSIYYLKLVDIPSIYHEYKLMIYTGPDTYGPTSESTGANIPTSSYETIQAGEFKYIDIVIPVCRIKETVQRGITVYFRDSIYTLRKHKTDIRNGKRLNYRVHKHKVLLP